jgi:hypothetical protein
MSDMTVQSSAPTRVGIEAVTAPGLQLGDYVWQDSDMDGQQNEGTGSGINGIQVSLYNDLDGDKSTTADQTLIGTQFTTNDPTSGDPGYYLFQALSSSNYFVRFYTGATYPNISPTNTGSDTSDSDGVLVGGQPYTESAMYALVADDLTIDQGFYGSAPPPPPPATGSLGDTVWYDADMDGVIDGGESGMSGITVTLSGLTYTGASVSLTTTTDGSGYYLFPLVESGSYTVTTNVGTGYLATYDLDGTGTLSTADTTLAAGQNRTDVDF